MRWSVGPKPPIPPARLTRRRVSSLTPGRPRPARAAGCRGGRVWLCTAIRRASSTTRTAYTPAWVRVTGMFHHDASETLRLDPMSPKRQGRAEGEEVVEDVHRDARLETAGADDQPPGDEAEREPVEEQREVLRTVGRGEEQRREQDRTPLGHQLGGAGGVELQQRARGLHQVAAEEVLLPRCLEGRGEQHDEGQRHRGCGELVEVWGSGRFTGPRHDQARPELGDQSDHETPTHDQKKRQRIFGATEVSQRGRIRCTSLIVAQVTRIIAPSEMFSISRNDGVTVVGLADRRGCPEGARPGRRATGSRRRWPPSWTARKSTVQHGEARTRLPPGVAPRAEHLVVGVGSGCGYARVGCAASAGPAAGLRRSPCSRPARIDRCRGGGYRLGSTPYAGGGKRGTADCRAAAPAPPTVLARLSLPRPSRPVLRRASRASDRSRPSSSSDSKSGGETRRPVTATRTGPKALRGFSPSSSTRAVRRAVSIASVVHSGQRGERVVRGLDHRPAVLVEELGDVGAGPGRRRPRRRAGSRACRRPPIALPIRSCTSGTAALSRTVGSSVGGSRRRGRRPAARAAVREVSSATESSRMWVALIASAFFRSNRAGFGLTRLDARRPPPSPAA